MMEQYIRPNIHKSQEDLTNNEGPTTRTTLGHPQPTNNYMTSFVTGISNAS
jgi:hypothetical protein